MPTEKLVFDVNETLLDLSPLDAVFAQLFGDAGLRRTWFASLLHWSTVTTLTRQYQDFTTLAGDCLDALARQRGIDLDDNGRQEVFASIATLPPHADVPGALARLSEHGFTLIALTNSAQNTVDRQFEHAGLTGYFDHVLSVDAARCYKPHPSAYAVAAGALGCPNAELRLIAAHDWDVTGAIRAGLKGAFVARNGSVFNRAGEQPEIVGDDLADVAKQLLSHRSD